MSLPPTRFPHRVRYSQNGPTCAVRSVSAGGHNTACLTWLAPENRYKWLPGDSEVTCDRCVQSLARQQEQPAGTDEETPGTTGSLRERVADVISNEVPPSYAALATERAHEVIATWETEALDRARQVTHKMFADLLPGQTGKNMADEVASRILAAVMLSPSPLPTEGS